MALRDKSHEALENHPALDVHMMSKGKFQKSLILVLTGIDQLHPPIELQIIQMKDGMKLEDGMKLMRKY